jgi:hypothetical protein
MFIDIMANNEELTIAANKSIGKKNIDSMGGSRKKSLPFFGVVETYETGDLKEAQLSMTQQTEDSDDGELIRTNEMSNDSDGLDITRFVVVVNVIKNYVVTSHWCIGAML